MGAVGVLGRAVDVGSRVAVLEGVAVRVRVGEGVDVDVDVSVASRVLVGTRVGIERAVGVVTAAVSRARPAAAPAVGDAGRDEPTGPDAAQASVARPNIPTPMSNLDRGPSHRVFIRFSRIPSVPW
jgi:hypothetical protein